MRKRMPTLWRGRVLLSAMIVSCLASPLSGYGQAAKVSEPASSATLRVLAERCNLPIGVAISSWRKVRLDSDPKYAATIARQFDVAIPEIAMQWDQLGNARSPYNFGAAEATMAFAQKNGMKVRGHMLVWDQMLPKWLTEAKWSREELKGILREHIQEEAGHFRGRVRDWIVVNEAIGTTGTLKDTIWAKGIGKDYIELAFRWAHEADPQARLFYNDFNDERKDAKSEAVYNMVADLVHRGVPIHGVGLQAHFLLDWPPDAAVVADLMRRYAALGLEVQITEMDVRMKTPSTPAMLEKQAKVYGDMMRVALEAPNCTGFAVWGLTDGTTSWIPEWYPGEGAALLFNDDYTPKPAYFVVKAELERAAGSAKGREIAAQRRAFMERKQAN